jgi:hypothetical protein
LVQTTARAVARASGRDTEKIREQLTQATPFSLSGIKKDSVFPSIPRHVATGRVYLQQPIVNKRNHKILIKYQQVTDKSGCGCRNPACRIGPPQIWPHLPALLPARCCGQPQLQSSKSIPVMLIGNRDSLR